MNIWWNKIIYNLGHISSLTDGNGGITKWLWFYIKKQRKDNFGVASLKHDNVYNDNQMKAELLNNYFTSVFTPHSSEPPPIISDTSFPDIYYHHFCTDINGVLNLPIFWNYVLLKWLLSWHLYFKHLSINPVFHLIETSKYCPNNIVPIFKKGDCTLCSNYRPVSLTCTCSKTFYAFTHILPPLPKQHIV